MENIIEAFVESNELIVFPAHPRTQKYLKAYGLMGEVEKAGNIVLIPPVGYLDMLVLEENARKILTDSGGVQKEAYFLKVPCITLRDRTEWVETVEDRWNILVGADREKIIRAIKEFEPSGETYTYKFGDGKANKKIGSILRGDLDVWH